MASNNAKRTGTGAMNLDSRGRVNQFNRSLSTASGRRATANFWRRKSTGGSGG